MGTATGTTISTIKSERELCAELGNGVSKTTTWLARGGFVATPVILWICAALRIGPAVAAAVAFPVPTYMTMNVSLPRSDYVRAAKALANADPSDGDAAITRAEASWRAYGSRVDTEKLLIEGLAHAPMNAQGWVLLAEIDANAEPERAMAAFCLSLSLAPLDYWLAGRRARDGVIWNKLYAECPDAMFRQVRLLWESPTLHQELLLFLARPGAPALIGRAFGADPEGLRAINRWLTAAERRTLVRSLRSGQHL